MKHPTVTLAKLVSINPSTPRGLLATNEEVAIVPMASVSERGSMTVHEYRPASTVSAGLSYLSNGDVLVAKITPCFENNKIALATIDRAHAFGSTEFHVLRVDDRRLDNRYLTHFLRQDLVRNRGVRRMTGSGGQRRVPKSFLEELEILLPPLDEQRRIAAILDQADALRHKRQAATEALQHLRRAILVETFGWPEINPRRLPIVPFGTVIREGPTNGLYRPANDYGDGTPILRIADFYDGKVVDVDRLRRLRATEKEVAIYGLREGDVVINRVNSREYLGKSTLIPRLGEETVFESNMMRIRLDREKINPVYCIEVLQLPFIRKQILRSSKDAVNQSSINQGDVRSFEILLPPLDEQREFARRLDEIDKILVVHHAQARRFDALFASLQHRAFNGELTAKAVQRELAGAG